MKLKQASNRPDLAEKLFSSKSSLHQQFLTDRQTQGIRRETESDFELLQKEAKQIQTLLTKTSLNKYKVIVYDDKWEDQRKDAELKKALAYRWKHDQRFHDTVEAARAARKYLLYSSKTAPLELGGKRSIKTSKIEGENKVGRMIMELAEFQF
jgi:3-oxoacyl-ACP reductase-like protein